MKSFIVSLEDGTTYNVSANDSWLARCTIEDGLRNRLDFRKVANVTEIKGCTFDVNSKYTNVQGNKELQSTSGWTYKWI